ncbi:class II aldolase/adducin family protein [Poseidonocella sp. HB161398]|uniref:class II aldolase/adducin family protein n=1 Tax=Poseidonocella sp. HB161398 TaxID=2320855 RepID=UPI001107CED6|nr:class II aldolase/adducin family protein [Poseidonocella sp. HB161398]
MTSKEGILREEIVQRCREMNANGINQGTSGNISVRLGDHMLISPSATPYDAMTPEMVAKIAIDDRSGAWEGPKTPSTEWRFHQRILRERPDCPAVIHAHPTYCTAIGILRRAIPAVHYMVAAFGGTDVRCAGYARYGTEELSDLVLAALQDRTACLMANHGMVAMGETLAKAMWRAVELETIARQYVTVLQTGADYHVLSDAEIAETMDGFASYGLQAESAAA